MLLRKTNQPSHITIPTRRARKTQPTCRCRYNTLSRVLDSRCVEKNKSLTYMVIGSVVEVVSGNSYGDWVGGGGGEWEVVSKVA